MRSLRNLSSLLLLAALALVVVPAGAAPAAVASPPPRPREEPKHRPPLTPKYFREPGGSLGRGHYDARFFRHEVQYAEHRVVLRDLVRSYLATMDARGVETWLAHGTLLGWWWSGGVMPWDFDLDVQVSNDTLRWLGDHLNRTEHAYTPPADVQTPVPAAKSYLLDVNPHHVDVTRGDGMNIIDARWIDMANGMFIDITGLRERNPDTPGVWSCKNAHRYAGPDLWPMRTTEFEGVRARVPYSVQKLLSAEYGPKSLVTEEHAGHRWDRDARGLVLMSPEERQRRHEARERKRRQMVRDGRLPAS